MQCNVLAKYSSLCSKHRGKAASYDHLSVHFHLYIRGGTEAIVEELKTDCDFSAGNPARQWAGLRACVSFQRDFRSCSVLSPRLGWIQPFNQVTDLCADLTTTFCFMIMPKLKELIELHFTGTVPRTISFDKSNWYIEIRKSVLSLVSFIICQPFFFVELRQLYRTGILRLTREVQLNIICITMAGDIFKITYCLPERKHVQCKPIRIPGQKLGGHHKTKSCWGIVMKSTEIY